MGCLLANTLYMLTYNFLVHSQGHLVANYKHIFYVSMMKAIQKSHVPLSMKCTQGWESAGGGNRGDRSITIQGTNMFVNVVVSFLKFLHGPNIYQDAKPEMSAFL